MVDPLPRVRSDRLADEVNFRDTGCDVAPACLRCPLARCRYDVPGGVRTFRIQQRTREVERLRADGLSVREIAERLGVSRRTVFRDQA